MTAVFPERGRDWDIEAINAQRLAVMAEQPALASHACGVLVLDDSGDRKDGHATAHVAHQYIGLLLCQGSLASHSVWPSQ